MTENRLSYLFYRVVDGTASQTEKIELAKLSILPEYETELLELMNEGWETFVSKENIFNEIQSATMLNKAVDTDTPISAPPAHRVRFLKTAWFRYAAAVIICLGIGAYLWTTSRDSNGLATTSNNKFLQTDIGPGGEKAVLTLADGTKIILDSAANGNLAQQGNAAIVKLANGQIVYNLKGLAEGNVMMNTMATPKGGQYQLTLPDGSKVWLNAASSITFPAVFVGATRNVKITGEVYFEIVKNKQKPFIVDVDEKVRVQVLGTSFNINSYADEGDIKATLIEGSIKVANDNKQTILKPGQQAQISNTTAVVASSDRQLEIVNADIDQTLAWKNGVFNFNGLGVRSVMAQLARWYDINVRYEGAMPSNIFRGEMYRDVKLSFVLGMLHDMGIKYKMDGKTLIVL